MIKTTIVSYEAVVFRAIGCANIASGTMVAIVTGIKPMLSRSRQDTDSI